MIRYEGPGHKVRQHPSKTGAKLHHHQVLVHDQVEGEQAVEQRRLGNVSAGAGLARELSLLA